MLSLPQSGRSSSEHVSRPNDERTAASIWSSDGTSTCLKVVPPDASGPRNQRYLTAYLGRFTQAVKRKSTQVVALSMKREFRLSTILAAVVLLGYWTSGVGQFRWANLAVSVTVYLGAAAVTLWGARLSSTPGAFRFLAAALFAQGVGEGAFFVAEQFSDEFAPFPGPADVVYLSAYVLLALGLVSFIRSTHPTSYLPLVPGAAAAVVSAWFLFSLGEGWWFGLGSAGDVVSAGYLIGPSVLIGIAVTSVLAIDLVHGAARHCVIGIVSFCVADLLFNMALRWDQDFQTGGAVSSLWIASALFIALGALHPRRGETPASGPSQFQLPTRQMEPEAVLA